MNRRRISAAVEIYRNEGAVALIKSTVQFFRIQFRSAYDEHVRSRLPRKVVNYNGVSVHTARYLDSIIPWHETDLPTYENAIVNAVHENVQSNDKVVVVGGGVGVSSVVAARRSNLQVDTFEGSEEKVKDIQNTIELNDVSNIRTHHTIVGEEIALFGDSGGASTIPPRELPDCDVLILDCEGAERQILSNIEMRPRVIIVETHGHLDSTSGEIEDLLEEAGYSIRSKQPAEERLSDFCVSNDIFVLAGVSINEQ